MAAKTRDNLPLVGLRSGWRMALASLVTWGPALALGGWITLGLGWRVPGGGWLISLMVVTVPALFLLVMILQTLSQRVFRHQQKAYRLLAERKAPEALAELQKHLAFIEQHPLLDRWRTVLFLYINKHSLRELALINMAYAHTQCGELEQARALYEKCLTINPRNEWAIDNLNLIAALSGQPLRPGGSGLTFFDAVDLKEQRRLGTFAAVIGGVGIVYGWSLVTALMPDMAWYLVTFVGAVGFYLLGRALVGAYRLAAKGLVLLDFYRAQWFCRARRYNEALKALEVQQAFFEEHPWVDNLRWLLLLSPTSYGFREWVLISMGDIHLDMGDAEQYIAYHQECLFQNPKNVFARTRLDWCNTILTSLGKATITLPPAQAA